jgi:hypothetical protein
MLIDVAISVDRNMIKKEGRVEVPSETCRAVSKYK